VVVVEEEEIMAVVAVAEDQENMVVVVAVGVEMKVATFSRLEIQTKLFKRQLERLWNTVWIWIHRPRKWTRTLRVRLVPVPA
jgi:hypothetical protein